MPHAELSARALPLEAGKSPGDPVYPACHLDPIGYFSHMTPSPESQRSTIFRSFQETEKTENF